MGCGCRFLGQKLLRFIVNKMSRYLLGLGTEAIRVFRSKGSKALECKVLLNPTP